MEKCAMGGLTVRRTDETGDGRGAIVVLLHGFGAPGDDLVPLARELSVPAGTRFVLPEAPLDLGRAFMGGRAWWPIDLEARMRRIELGLPRDRSEVPEGMAEARARVDALLDEVDTTMRRPGDRLVLGGFSQGAMLALDTALRSRRALDALVLLSGTHLAADEWAPLMAGRSGLPVFMSHGTHDELLPFAVSEELGAELARAGMLVSWVPFRGGHTIPPDVLASASAFLTRALEP